MSLLGSLLYICVVLAVFVGSYSFLFNKNLLQKYSTFLHIPKVQINEYIEKNLKSLKLIRVQIDDNEDDDEYKGAKARDNYSDLHEDLRNNIIGLIFSTTMALSVGLIILILLELGDFMDADSRLGFFKFTINALMLLLVMILPISIISLLIVQDGLPRTYKSIGVVTVSYITWLVILHKCGDLTLAFNAGSRNFIEKIVNQVSIVGITILAILSGVGSTSTPYKIFEKYKSIKGSDRPEVGELEINTAIQYFNNTSTLLVKRKQELNKLHVTTGGTIYNMPNTSDSGFKTPKKLSLLHRVQSFANIPMNNTEENELNHEIESLKSLRNSLYDDLIKLISKYHDQTSQNNIRLEAILEWANWVLAVYCVYRIVNVFLIKLPILYLYGEDDYTVQSEVIDSGEEASISKDALAITLSKVILTIFRNLPISEAQLVSQLSFILSASLFVCSFSNVLTTFKSFSKFFPGHLGSATTKNWLKYLVVAELVGVYVIATALLIRTNLPANLSNQISQILSLSGSSVQGPRSSIKEVVFIDNWFDKIFAITCVVTGVVILVKRVLDEDRLTTGASSSYDEELLIEDSSVFKLA